MKVRRISKLSLFIFVAVSICIVRVANADDHDDRDDHHDRESRWHQLIERARAEDATVAHNTYAISFTFPLVKRINQSQSTGAVAGKVAILSQSTSFTDDHSSVVVEGTGDNIFSGHSRSLALYSSLQSPTTLQIIQNCQTLGNTSMLGGEALTVTAQGVPQFVIFKSEYELLLGYGERAIFAFITGHDIDETWGDLRSFLANMDESFEEHRLRSGITLNLDQIPGVTCALAVAGKGMPGPIVTPNSAP